MKHWRIAAAWGVVPVAALVIAAGLIARWRQSEPIDPAYVGHFHRLKERRAEAPDRPLVLALGGAATEQGFRPDAVAAGAGGSPVCLNFGVAAAGPERQLVALRRLDADGIRPTLVMIEVPAAEPASGADGALREMLDLGRRGRVLPVFVLMPEPAGVRGGRPLRERVRLHTWLGELSDRFAAPLIDASDWLPDECFDGGGLTPEGATRYSERLGREAVAPLLRRR